jgi:hypothetical protein
MNRRNRFLAVAAIASCMCLCAWTIPAAADATPKFGKTYTGSVSGTIVDKNSSSGNQTNIDWQVTGLRFKLRKKVGGLIKNALYKVTAGTAVINAVETGNCSYTSHETVKFPEARDKHGADPLILTYTPLYKTTGWTGSLPLATPIKALETCPDGEGAQQPPSEAIVQLPDLLNMGFASHKTLKHLRGKYVYDNPYDYGHSSNVATWKWDLKSH